MQGGQGYTTTTILDGAITGSGTILVDGGNASSAAATTLTLDNGRIDTNLAARDGTITWTNTDGRTVPFAGGRGGTITFEDNRSVLNLFDTSFTNSLFPLTAMKVEGFAKGDQLNVMFNAGLQIDPTPGATPGFVAQWNQATHTLSLESVFQGFFGPETVELGAVIRLQGSYAANSFSAKLIADAQTDKQLPTGEFEVGISTSATSPGTAAIPLAPFELLPSAQDMLGGQFAALATPPAGFGALAGGASPFAPAPLGGADAALAAAASGAAHLLA